MTLWLKLAALDPAGVLGLLSPPMSASSDDHADAALVLRAREGDRGAARALFLRHRDAVGSLTLRLLRHRADAEEAAAAACGCSLATVKRWIAAVDARVAPLAKLHAEAP